MDQSIYEIHVAGTVAAEELQDMGAVKVGAEQVNTVLYGVPDEAALFGLLTRLRALGLEVIEIRRVSDFAGPIADPCGPDHAETDDE
ncbi:MAG TPA: hypothetical protein VFX53_17375 [Pedococcus sp.]|jgi:hypothetical protein|nr:hypothetical protein [Pedococcus sp.]